MYTVKCNVVNPWNIHVSHYNFNSMNTEKVWDEKWPTHPKTCDVIAWEGEYGIYSYISKLLFQLYQMSL